MGKTRFPNRLKDIADWRAAGYQVAFVGDVVGTGSSRKSACNSVLWHIGQEIPACQQEDCRCDHRRRHRPIFSTPPRIPAHCRSKPT